MINDHVTMKSNEASQKVPSRIVDKSSTSVQMNTSQILIRLWFGVITIRSVHRKGSR